jgi:hypothetical protein
MSRGASESCAWRLNPFSYAWDTGCGNAFILDEGTPQQNSMNFCCFCGNQLESMEEDNADQD